MSPFDEKGKYFKDLNLNKDQIKKTNDNPKKLSIKKFIYILIISIGTIFIILEITPMKSNNKYRNNIELLNDCVERRINVGKGIDKCLNKFYN
tara:strand:+ start:18417 stop:18695 length:279 start_codon:yes stop_codon:yes gene_type:complete